MNQFVVEKRLAWTGGLYVPLGRFARWKRPFLWVLRALPRVFIVLLVLEPLLALALLLFGAYVTFLPVWLLLGQPEGSSFFAMLLLLTGFVALLGRGSHLRRDLIVGHRPRRWFAGRQFAYRGRARPTERLAVFRVPGLEQARLAESYLIEALAPIGRDAHDGVRNALQATGSAIRGVVAQVGGSLLYLRDADSSLLGMSTPPLRDDG